MGSIGPQASLGSGCEEKYHEASKNIICNRYLRLLTDYVKNNPPKLSDLSEHDLKMIYKDVKTKHLDVFYKEIHTKLNVCMTDDEVCDRILTKGLLDDLQLTLPSARTISLLEKGLNKIFNICKTTSQWIWIVGKARKEGACPYVMFKIEETPDE